MDYVRDLDSLASQAVNEELLDLPPELYPLMSPRELRTALLLKSHLEPKKSQSAIAFSGDLQRSSRVSASVGSFGFNKDDVVQPGTEWSIFGDWLVVGPNEEYSSLGLGNLSICVTDQEYHLFLFGKQQVSCLSVGKGDEDDSIWGRLVIDPEIWRSFLAGLKVLNESKFFVLLPEMIPCSPGFDWGENREKTPAFGPIFSIASSRADLRSGVLGNTHYYLACEYILKIRRAQFIPQEILMHICKVRDITEAEARKILLRVSKDTPTALTGYATSLTMAKAYTLFKRLGLDPLIEAVEDASEFYSES
jgi:hypothetical protein